MSTATDSNLVGSRRGHGRPQPAITPIAHSSIAGHDVKKEDLGNHSTTRRNVPMRGRRSQRVRARASRVGRRHVHPTVAKRAPKSRRGRKSARRKQRRRRPNPFGSLGHPTATGSRWAPKRRRYACRGDISSFRPLCSVTTSLRPRNRRLQPRQDRRLRRRARRRARLGPRARFDLARLIWLGVSRRQLGRRGASSRRRRVSARRR